MTCCDERLGHALAAQPLGHDVGRALRVPGVVLDVVPQALGLVRLRAAGEVALHVVGQSGDQQRLGGGGLQAPSHTTVARRWGLS